MAFDIKTVNGLGTGALGDVTISSSSTQVNSYANVIGIGASGYQLTIGTPSIGNYGGFTVGQEIMFHSTGCLGTETTNMGAFGVATILAVNGSTLSLDKAIPVVDLAKYVCQVVTVPNFNNLTVNCAVSALAYNANYKYGGILIAKVKGKFDISNGMWLTEGKGLPAGSPLKPDGIVITNDQIKEKLIMNQGNGIAALICNQYKDTIASRIGASWSGTLGAGTPGGGQQGNYWAAGEIGGVGYGGSGGGFNSYSGVHTPQGYSGKELGGGFGGGSCRAANAGATVLLLINQILNFSQQTISTGGEGGNSLNGSRGDGSSFWYGGNGGAGYGGGGSGTSAVCMGAAGGGAGFGYIATNSSLTTNAVAYALDTLAIDKSGLLISDQPLDCAVLTSVDGFTAEGQQPSGTNRRVIFSTNSAVVLGNRTYPITTNAVAADTVTIGGVTFTAIASGANGNQFNVGGTIAATAANLASVLNSNSTINVLYTATSDSNGVITLTEKIAKGNTPTAATKTGTIVIGTGTSVTSIPRWYKLSISSGAATLSPVSTQTPTISSVLSEGNTVDELLTVTSVAAFIGKLVYPAIALMSPFDATVFPTVKLSIKGHCNQDQYQKDELSAEYDLADVDNDIVSITFDSVTTGQATVNVQVSLKQNGTWSGWMTTISAKGQKASAIKYKTTYTVSKLDGTDTAKLNSVSCIYRKGNAYVSGNTAEILTITQDYQNPLRYARCFVKHKPLMDAQIKAYVSFRKEIKKRSMLNVGTGTNERQLIQLTDTGIDHNTLQIQFDGKITYAYDFNTELSQILCIAPIGTAITASYEYGVEAEEWLEMTNEGEHIYNSDGLYATSFNYALADTITDKTISVVKVELYRPTGTVTDEVLGVATGKKQLFILPHYAKKETIQLNGFFSYDDTSRILTVVANKDTQLKITYDWIAETHELEGLVCAWNE